VGGVDRDVPVPGGLVGRLDVDAGPVDVDADEAQREAIVASSSSVSLGVWPPAEAREASVSRPSSITVMRPALRSRVAASAAWRCSGCR